MNKTLLVIAVLLLLQGTAAAQSSQRPTTADLDYTYAELRFVDVDTNGGDGFKLGGSFDLNGPWILLGSITDLDFNNNVDASILQIGGGYVWGYNTNFDLIATLQLVRTDVDSLGGSADDTGLALSAGTRGWLAPQFEIRASVNHVNLDNSDTFLEIAGDYHFTDQVAAGLSVEFAGDTDIFTVGARWFFN
ncbi:MAG: hypothetical protein EX272_02100 [Chromatiales bacterium]|nr:MAG: hypothetical protein EX272_02100 [Chromatiales bacterium]